MKKLTSILALFLLLTSFRHQGYHVGEIADDFQLKNVNGQMVSMANYPEAKGFIVIFTCNHCPFSKKYEDRINALHKKYEKKGYPVIAINPNDAAQYPEDNFENMVKRAKEKKFAFPYLHDETQAVAAMYGATKTPDVFVLQKENKDLIVKYTGAIDDNADDAKAAKEKYVEQAVDEMLAGRSVSVSFTKAIGCSIKWKK
ncbi:MAG: thioredoxin family protein [Bacteroidetes bacterium]|nr:thioredoxin family protein [Bacteroidota bacterium]